MLGVHGSVDQAGTRAIERVRRPHGRVVRVVTQHRVQGGAARGHCGRDVGCGPLALGVRQVEDRVQRAGQVPRPAGGEVDQDGGVVVEGLGRSG